MGQVGSTSVVEGSSGLGNTKTLSLKSRHGRTDGRSCGAMTKQMSCQSHTTSLLTSRDLVR